MAKCVNWSKIFILALILMQMSDDFLPIQTRRCNALRMINLDAPQMALQGDTIELSCSYSMITSQDLQTSSPPLLPQDNHGIGNHFSESKHASSIEKLPRSSAGGNHLIGTDELAGKRTRSITTATSVRGVEAQVESVYAIKWYKDEREFFRFLVQDWPHKQAFPLDGINIDVDKSDNRTVVLKNISLKTSGLFRCEVSTEAPTFLTQSIARKVFIYSDRYANLDTIFDHQPAILLTTNRSINFEFAWHGRSNTSLTALPSDGPTIEQPLKRTNQVRYLGDQLNFVCSSRESKPATQIDWIINETLNLSSVMAPTIPANANGTPLFQIKTRRVIRLPAVNSFQTNHRASVPTANSAQSQYQSKDFGSQHSSSGAQQLQRRDESVNLDASASPRQKSPLPFTAYELDDSSWPPTAKLLDGPASAGQITLGTNSLHQLLETTISWLNFSVDTDLLQYLSRVGPLSEWPTADVVWSTRKTIANASSTNVHLAPLNLSPPSLESYSSKARRKNIAKAAVIGHNTSGGSQKRSSSQQQQQSGATFVLRVRCVARVLHLSMSDDIKLKIVNMTKGSARQEQLARAEAQGRKSNSGSSLPIISKTPVYYTILLVTLQLILSQSFSK